MTRKFFALTTVFLCVGCGLTEEETTGSIEILSTPSQAEIAMDDVDLDLQTPATIEDVEEGTHRFKLQKEGYQEWSGSTWVYPGETSTVSATMQMVCGLGLIGDQAEPPTIVMTSIGDRAVKVSGTASNLDAANVKVVIWVQAIEWYVQPTTADPYTDVCWDGTWSMSGHPGDRVVALLVDASIYSSGSGRTTLYPPDAEGVLAFDDQIPPGSDIPCEGHWQGVVGDLNLAPEIHITKLTDRARWFEGTANNIDNTRHRVVLWVKTDIWYIQPWTANPWTLICPDGKWANDSHSGNIGLALLVDEAYVPTSTSGVHPSGAVGVLAWDEKTPPF